MADIQAVPRTEVVRAGRGGTLWGRIWENRYCYLFLLPALVLGAMFTVYPIVASYYFSVLDWSGITSDKVFVGLANYTRALSDPLFWGSFGRSLVFTAISVPALAVLSFLIAVALNTKVLRMRAIFRTLFFLPVVTTAAVVGVVMSLLLSPFNGPINAMLVEIGIISKPIDFLGNPSTALWTVSAVYVWKSLGTSMIYWLVALQTVPAELYEAARTDGANGWQLHRYITLPAILPFAVIIVLIDTVHALQVFPLVQSMTGGGPAFATTVVEVYIYRLAFASETAAPQLGYASAVGVIFGIAVALIGALQAWGVRKAHRARRGN
jgi:ABC-type sugar transport system permease subunit